MKRGVLIVSALLISCAGGAYFFRPQSPPPAAAPRPVPTRGPIEALDKAIQDRFHTMTSFGLGRITPVPQHYQPGLEFRPEHPAEFAALGEAHKNKQRVAFFLCGRGVLRDTQPLTKSDEEKLKKRFTPQQVEKIRREFSEALQRSLGTDISAPVLVAGYKLPPPYDVNSAPPISQQEKQQSVKEEAARNALWTRALAITPTAPEIREFARKALLTTAKQNSYRGTLRDWSVEARPVRANKAACLRCHDSLGASPYFVDSRKDSSKRLKIGDALGVVVYVYQPLADSQGAL